MRNVADADSSKRNNIRIAKMYGYFRQPMPITKKGEREKRERYKDVYT